MPSRCAIDINECLHGSPCHNGGTCINSNGGFQCVCPPDTTGPYCSDEAADGTVRGRRDYALKLEEVVGIICSLFVLVLVVTCCVCCKRFKMKDARNGHNGQNGHNGFVPSSNNR